MKSRDIAIVGICLAIGAILRFVANMFPGAIVGNPVIALYCLAIILIRPTLKEAVGIGLVAGVVSMLISHSIFPPANLISEPLGALTCAAVYGLVARLPLGPAATTFIATCVSGFSFVLIAMAVMLASIVAVPTGTVTGFFLAVLPIVLITAAFNAVVTQVLFFPAQRMYVR
ncbi:hypothetical protein AZH53_06220 [Methanomicrobiaceae archaeon CYW5]|uniref:hypothetical protein n=1 Tax=Methanovulcanius yangii TaxID=1789227 RepID=UPI0029CA7459|nr:hypothetical protein [Methanovulcanius yangii]MBT8508003.1 hypothetical protein [Methanovulcanius yangii]